MKLKGTIRRSDLEGGHWVLLTESGEQYQLTGVVDGAKDGLQAEVEGKVDKQAVGFGMMGPHFNVHKITALQMGLSIVGYEASTGALRAVYDKMLERPLPPAYKPQHGGAPGIITAHSLDPALIPLVFATSSTLNGAGPLTWPERELVNAITSRLNQCFY